MSSRRGFLDLSGPGTGTSPALKITALGQRFPLWLHPLTHSGSAGCWKIPDLRRDEKMRDQRGENKGPGPPALHALSSNAMAGGGGDWLLKFSPAPLCPGASL